MNAITNRRSIRKYRDEKLKQEDITKILEAGILAPSAKNRQPWKYIVYMDEAKETLLNEMEKGLNKKKRINKALINNAIYTLKVMRQAPVLIMILNTNGKSIFSILNPINHVTEICDVLSIGASVENMLLTATEMGIGSLWIGNTCFAYKELIKCIGTKSQLVGAISLGYPNENPSQRPRKAFCDVVEYRMNDMCEIHR